MTDSLSLTAGRMGIRIRDDTKKWIYFGYHLDFLDGEHQAFELIADTNARFQYIRITPSDGTTLSVNDVEVYLQNGKYMIQAILCFS